ncbi:MAG: hypothetical protein WCD35_14415, partial [Mycobacteriales bacterium]
MLTSINPLGQRARGHRWGPVVALFTAASALGGLMTGLVLGLLGDLLSLPLWVGALACAAAVGLDLAHRVPGGHRQVDEDWLTRYRPWVYAVGFGWQLGTGVVTIVTSAATYALLVLMLVAGLPTAAVAGALFGLVRALPLLLARRADSPPALRALAARLEAARGT